MQFVTMQNYVIEKRLPGSRRDEIKEVLNAIYGVVWGLEAWTFKEARGTITGAVGTQQTAPSGLGRVVTIQDSYGEPLEYLDEGEFFDVYVGSSAVTGSRPQHYTTWDDDVFFGPGLTASGEVFQVLYTKRFTPMSLDTDEPDLPQQVQYPALVQGARASLLKSVNDPTWVDFASDMEEAVAYLRREFLSKKATGVAFQWPAYRVR